MKKTMYGFWRRQIRPIAIVVLVLTTFRSAIADWNDVPTGSMTPSIIAGDRIFVNKLAYGLKIPFTTYHLLQWSTPERGEIVVFNSPTDGTRLVKRVVGLPGDTIAMVNNRLFINGEPVSYETVDPEALPAIQVNQPLEVAAENLGDHRHMVMSTPLSPAMRSFGPIEVPAGQYFMLGDNRDNSADSRYHGPVPLDQILGRSSAVALSLDYDHYFLPRWSRFLKPLD